MARPFNRLQSLVEQGLVLFVFAILVAYSYALFFRAPYAGFEWDPSTGTVITVYTTNLLQPGDQLVEIDSVPLAEYSANLRKTFFADAQPGDFVPLLVQRNEQRLVISWSFPGFTQDELLDRLTSQWWLAFVFWGIGGITTLALRPKDTRWRLMIAFHFLTAIWLSASAFSKWHIWESALVLRSAMWLCVPVYWHLHWILPKPLKPLPSFIWVIFHIAGAGIAIVQWFQILPPQSYAVGFLLALAGSALLLMAHFLFRPVERRDLFPLLVAGVLAFGLPILLGIIVVSGQSLRTFLITLLALPILPLTYLYAAYRRQLGGLEVRANRIVALYLFFILVGAALLVIVPAVDSWLNFSGDDAVIGIVAALATGLVTAFSLAPFQRFVEHHVLGIPLPPIHLLETYAARITISPNESTLIHLLRNEILPSLLIRQSALIRLGENSVTVVYAQNAGDDQLLAVNDIPLLLKVAGRYRPAAEADSHPLPWVRLALTLSIERKPIGLWLLGRRDPDDYYGRHEIDTLQSLADQTAIALTNIIQAERLRALYQADMEQNENQRAYLARELHDNLLNELGRLKMSMDEKIAPPRFFETCNTLITALRQTITGLRPAMLNYGLGPALRSLSDELTDRAENVTVSLELTDEGPSYHSHLAQHVYRIVQQACENALKHAQPTTLTITGHLRSDLIDLTIADDGKGFEAGDKMDLAGLVARKHFGLAGMIERAALIGAEIGIDSAPGRGTKVHLRWVPQKP